MGRLKGKVFWEEDRNLKKEIEGLIKKANLTWIVTKNIYAYRSQNASTRAYARIWGLPSLWQKALKLPPSYIIEVIAEKYNALSKREKERVLIHELSHIPKNFSGALVPHIKRGKRSFYRKVKELTKQLTNNRE